MASDERQSEPLNRPPRVLVVEDDPESALSLTELLGCLGLESAVARNGEEALWKACEFLPDVVLLDLGLPVRDGYEVARILRQNPNSSTALIIAVTGQPEDGERAYQMGIDIHLAKPVDAGILMSILLDYQRELSG